MIVGKYMQRYKQSELRFNLSKMMLLSEVKKEMVKKLEIDLDIADVDEKLIEKLQKLINANSNGAVITYITLLDEENKYSVKFQARNLRVVLSDDLLKFLDSYPGISFKLR